MQSKFYAIILLVAAVASASSFAQTPAPPTTPAQRPSFDVVSIHLADPNTRGSDFRATQPDGYRAVVSADIAILLAYFPQGPWGSGRIQGDPAWAAQERYAIEAKVSEANLPEWTQQSNLNPEQKVLFQQMLQSLLADRFKLVFHRIPNTVAGYEIVEGKHPHLAPSIPGATLPKGQKLSDGGILVRLDDAQGEQLHFYNTTLSALAQFLPSVAPGGHPIADKTSLTGHYDFVITRTGADPAHPGAIYADDPDPLSHLDFNTIGLRAQSVKVPLDTLVIDHIEKPTEN